MSTTYVRHGTANCWRAATSCRPSWTAGTAPIRADKFVEPSWHLEVPFIKRPPSSAGQAWNSLASLTQAGTFMLGTRATGTGGGA